MSSSTSMADLQANVIKWWHCIHSRTSHCDFGKWFCNHPSHYPAGETWYSCGIWKTPLWAIHGTILTLAPVQKIPILSFQGLLIRGAEEHSLPTTYQERLLSQPKFIRPIGYRFKAGKWLFNIFWQRVSCYIETGVHYFKNEDGNVPRWFLIVFDCLLWTMWFYHDYFHSIIWGRGDGLKTRYFNQFTL